MRLVRASAVAMAVALLVPALHAGQAAAPAAAPAQAKPQGAPPAAGAMESDRKVAGGGITAAGWQGKVDASAAKQGGTINDSKFAEEGGRVSPDRRSGGQLLESRQTRRRATTPSRRRSRKRSRRSAIRIRSGSSSAATSWAPTSRACCTASPTATAATWFARFKGDVVTTVVKKTPNDAVAKAAADAPVSQDIEWRVKGNRVECAVNGTVVAGLRQSRSRGRGQARVDRRRLRDPLGAQHGRCRQRPEDDQGLIVSTREHSTT